MYSLPTRKKSLLESIISNSPPKLASDLKRLRESFLIPYFVYIDTQVSKESLMEGVEVQDANKLLVNDSIGVFRSQPLLSA